MNVKITKNGILVPIEVADAITLETLKECLQYTEKELEDYEVNGQWMHPDDVVFNKELIPSLKKLIHYFGG